MRLFSFSPLSLVKASFMRPFGSENYDEVFKNQSVIL